MRASSDRDKAYHCGFLFTLDDLIAGQRITSLFKTDFLFRAVWPITTQRQIYFAFVLLHHTPYAGIVDFMSETILKLLLQRRFHMFAFSKQDQPRSRHIQTVYDLHIRAVIHQTSPHTVVVLNRSPRNR
ncbi:Uncharacterised protein [Vibrio cholerae]|nr:Uncharacterised protein [Vibrio cholerae]